MMNRSGQTWLSELISRLTTRAIPNVIEGVRLDEATAMRLLTSVDGTLTVPLAGIPELIHRLAERLATQHPTNAMDLRHVKAAERALRVYLERL